MTAPTISPLFARAFRSSGGARLGVVCAAFEAKQSGNCLHCHALLPFELWFSFFHEGTHAFLLIVERERRMEFAPLEQLALSPQCGFASTEEGNVLAEDEQWAKLRMIVELADDVWGR